MKDFSLKERFNMHKSYFYGVFIHDTQEYLLIQKSEMASIVLFIEHTIQGQGKQFALRNYHLISMKNC
jgi:hypothetical protein